MHKEHRQTPRTHTGGGGGDTSPVNDQSQERGRETVSESWERQCAMADKDIRRGNGTICFCSAPILLFFLPRIGSVRLRREKIAWAQSQKKTQEVPFDWKRKEKNFPKKKGLAPHIKPLRRRAVPLASGANVALRLLASHQRNPVEKHSKALREPDYVTTPPPRRVAAWRLFGIGIFKAPSQGTPRERV